MDGNLQVAQAVQRDFRSEDIQEPDHLLGGNTKIRPLSRMPFHFSEE